MVKKPTNDTPRGGKEPADSREFTELRTMPAPSHARIAAAQARSRQLLDAAVAEETATAGSSRPDRKQAPWLLAGFGAAAAAVMVTALVVFNQPTTRLEPPANSPTGGVNSPTSDATNPTGGTDTPTGAPTDGVASSDSPAITDPFGLVPVNQEITFRYAMDLVDGRCSPVGKDTFASREKIQALKLTAVEVTALRAQSRLTWFSDTSRAELDAIAAATQGMRQGTLYGPGQTYLGEAERWGTECDGKGAAQLFGSATTGNAAALPPMPRPQGTKDSLTAMSAAVRADPGVVREHNKLADCFEAATGQNVDGMVDTSELAYYGDDGPEVGEVDAFWTCYSGTTLRAESRRAQREWLAAHPQVEKAWNTDTAWYAMRLDTAKQLIAEEEGKAGK